MKQGAVRRIALSPGSRGVTPESSNIMDVMHESGKPRISPVLDSRRRVPEVCEPIAGPAVARRHRQQGPSRCVAISGAMRTIFMMMALLAGFVSLPNQAAGQSCTADVQCPNGGRSVASCLGDTLIVRRSVCAGSCREVEERRENCGGGIGGVCTGGAYERVSGRCNSSLGTCERRADRELCSPSCSCRNGLLSVSTGQCSPAIGCHRAVKRCAGGCSCDPVPRCEGE